MTWFLRAIGVGDEIASRLDRAQLSYHAPTLWVGLALLVPIGLFIVLRHRRNLPHVAPGLRALMSACRIAVLLLLVTVLARPKLTLSEEVTHKPILAVIVDESASMALPAGPFAEADERTMAEAAGLVEPAKPESESEAAAAMPPEARKELNALSRVALADRVLAQQRAAVLEPLGERFDVRGYRVARSVRSAAPGEAAEGPTADAEETDLGGALDRAIQDAAGRRLAGIVLVSDGRWTTGPDPLQVVQRATGAGGERATPPPVWAVPAGSAEPIVDVGVVDVLAPAHVAKDDTVTVVATLESQGLDNRTVQVKLTDAAGEVMDEKPLTLSSRERQQVQLTYTAEEPGPAVLTVSVEEQTEEQVKPNNVQTAQIEVSTEKQRVLVLEGHPRWDFRFLDHALRRDNGLEATVVMESQLTAGDDAAAATAAADLPKAAGLPEDAAGFAEYAVVMLGDISPALLPPRLQEQLAKAVEEDGVGLIVQAGTTHMPRAFARGPLARLLPVKIDPSATIATGAALPAAAPATPAPAAALFPRELWGLEAPAFAPFRMEVTAAGSIHPALRLYDSATQNRGLWSRMPEFYWAAAATEAGQGATVLARLRAPGAANERPLLAERYAGRGRVLFIGTDSTYRWRRNIGSHLFYRFWGQAVRHVARDPGRSTDRSWIEVYPKRVEPGETVAVELYAVDAQGQPVTAAEVTLQVSGGDYSEPVRLAAAEEAGRFRGQWRQGEGGASAGARLGQYRLTYTDAQGEAVTAAVQVAGSGREMRRPIVDREALGTLADASGGELLELHELGRLTELVEGEPVTVAAEHESEVWDNWLTLVLLVGLYCTDVGVRRLLGLT